MLTDTHAHLYWDSFKEDFDEVVKRAAKAGVTTVINVGVDLKTSDIVTKLNRDKVQFLASIGIHPHDAHKYFANPDVSIHQDITGIEEIYRANESKVVMIGECGLDLVFDSNPDFVPSFVSPTQLEDLQIKLFEAQIRLAKKLNLPLSVHCRDDRSKNPTNNQAWDKTLEMVKDHYGILHCYSGLPKTTEKALGTNFLVSFAGNITYPKNEYLHEAVRAVPLDRIVLETDCPFLSPQSKRGQRNEPSALVEIAQTVAQIKNLPHSQVVQQTTANVRQLLRL